ncbi:MAG: sodium-translocating pyrophosphatase, partial [Syntrophobacterales bacterium]|nr:sodium-translocating pyrophosphatase [Syntrophobacterales bacterium]
MFKKFWYLLSIIFTTLFLFAPVALAGEADIKLPDLSQVTFNVLGATVSGLSLMYWGLLVCVIGAIFGAVQYVQTKNLSAHKSMLDVSEII